MKPPHDRATPERLDPAMCVINYERKEFQQAWFSQRERARLASRITKS